MSTFTQKLRVIWIIAMGFAIGLHQFAIANERIQWGEPTGRIVSARNDQPLYSVYAPAGRGLMLLDGTYVLQIDGIDVNAQTMSFTAYAHMSVPEYPSFWVRKFTGNMSFPTGGANGWLVFTMHYIGDRPYPLPSPQPIEIRFVPL